MGSYCAKGLMYIHRELEKEIAPFLERKEAIAIVGPRQAGKTTFLQHLAGKLQEQGKKLKFITFEKRDDLTLFNKSIEDFKTLAEQYNCVIIDEFQYASHGGQKLKYLYDTTNVKFVISGSSSLELTFQTGKYMVGRLLEFTLLPFSFREFLSFRDPELYTLVEQKRFVRIADFDYSKRLGEEITRRLVILLEEYALYGGYPAVVIAGTKDEKHKILEGIAENYLLRDIKDLLRLAASDELWRLEKLLAGQIGGMIKYEELSRASGLSYKELKKHLNILEKTYVISLIKPFFVNRRTELTKNPKVYFFDTGLRNYVLSDFRPVSERNDAGALMENYAFGLLSRRFALPPALKYWRTKSKAEIDFIVEEGQALYPFEVKYSSKHVLGKSLHSFIEKFHPPVAIVLTKDFASVGKIAETQLKFIPLPYY
ncbi:MAG: Uncharacterized protein G01um101433_114 [Parcubacteria group bacterium Gr01-1014_33]|nr:MAG: Uncharacterized protein G01um101433_114 [Parcubacteria group bacterium Gr01-1014_33]